MNTIAQIKLINENYNKEKEKLCALEKLVIETNDNLNLEEVENTLNYQETKELFNLVLYRSKNENMLKQLEIILNNKKSKEYPLINDVHYYPIINDIDFLTKESKIELDIMMKQAYYSRSSREDLKKLDKRIIDYLIKNSMLEKLYVFHCNCEDLVCMDKIITQENFDKLKEYWNKCQRDIPTTTEEDEEMNYGCFETGCWNDGSVEICSLEDFNEHLRKTEYKVKVKPDLTLDNI